MATPEFALNIEQFTISIEGVSEKLRVYEFSGNEQISLPFSYAVTVATTDNGLEFGSIVGKSVVLTILDLESEVSRYVTGIVSSIEQGSIGRKYTLYDVEIVPRIKLLDYRTDSRIFQEMSAPDIVKQVLQEGNIPASEFRLDLQGTYPTREYCVQYQESDLNFISRLLEEEGIYYFFEHTEESHVMVISDQISGYPPINGEKTVIYHGVSSAVSNEEFIYSFGYGENVVSGAVVQKDYNFKKPALNLESSKQGEVNNELEIYEFPGEFYTPEDGTARVNARLQSVGAGRQVAHGNANVRRFIPGYSFTLSKYKRDDLNQDYLLTYVAQSGNQHTVLDEGAGLGENDYQCTFEAVPATTPFRAPQVADRPRIEGIQTAIVVGPSGEEIYTDEFGRIKVQFHWDRQGENNEKSSCWIRVAQSWAGASWGAVFLPRIGHEVVVAFIEGDPDRPLVTGSVYHGTNRVPYKLPDEKTRSTIKSNSTPDGGGSNELRFEDKKDAEEIYLHGQKDWTIVIENDKNQTIGHDETLEVGNDRTKTVKNDQSESIGNDKTIDVGNDHNETIGKNMSLSVGENRTESVTGNHNETISKDMSLDVEKSRTINVSDDHTESIGKKMTLDVGADANISIGKNMSTMVDKKVVIDAGDSIALNCGQASLTLKKDGKIQISGSGITIKASGNLVLKGSKITEN
ncbi:MAG TPA: type VI secretion system tip protein VgrG [Nitrospiraceae bacterium]|nr:type VI secretion system tip protein VgrG [Nitrospiraceae bacterium]